MQQQSGRGAEPASATAGEYQSPNRPAKGRRAARSAPAPALRIAAPADLAVRGERETLALMGLPPGDGPEAQAALQGARQRIAFLEGALEASAKLEHAAQQFADRLEERSTRAREDYQRELSAMRGLVDQRERELRTLALEMGKLQGRLEVAEQRLIEARSEGSAAAERARSEGRAQIEALARAGAAPAPAAPWLEARDKRVLFVLLVIALLIWVLK